MRLGSRVLSEGCQAQGAACCMNESISTKEQDRKQGGSRGGAVRAWVGSGEWQVRFLGDENIFKLILVMGVQIYDYIKNH